MNLPEGEQYQGDVVDAWEMTATPLAEPVVGGVEVPLPGKPYQALILKRIQ